MSEGIPRKMALQNYFKGKGSRALPPEEVDIANLLEEYHPDYYEDTLVTLQTGPNKGERCHKDLAAILQADALIDDTDLAGAFVHETDLLVIGGGGAGCAAALAAAENGARVILSTKLRLGDSNTVMAEGGIQASIESGDTPMMHYEDTLKSGHFRGESRLIAALVMDGPEVIRWLIQKGMQFDQNPFGDLLTRRAGGTSHDRVVYCRDYTGLEMMRVLREAVRNGKTEVLEYSPVVELLTNETGHCAGAVIFSLDRAAYLLIKARSVIMATGGIGRLHLNGFPTSNHFGATADGLVLAYRLGARLKDIDSFQYHPTGMAYPASMAGSLITEGVRSAGAHLLNGLGNRFIDELKQRDCVTAAILRECAEGRGIVTDGGNRGVWLDTPTLERENPGILERRFPKLLQRGKICNIDPAGEPMLVYPTLHYQNGGVEIDENGSTTVPGLYAVGEVSGGIHGRNRIMGNALLEIICFGRRAGNKASETIHGRGHKKFTIEHTKNLSRELTNAGLSMEIKSPTLFPDYANFGIKQ